MGDNTALPGLGEIYAAEDRGGVKFQRVQIASYDSPSCDAFGRWRVSNPHTIFASKLLHGDGQSLFWDEVLASGTMVTSGPTVNKPYIDFTSTDVTAGKRTRQTFRRFNYQPGKGQLVLMTGVLELASGTKTGCVREIGLFDDDNGAFFESNAGVIGVTVRTKDSGSAVDATVTQANWNLDTMDGAADAGNPSGLTLDVSMAQIFVIDFQWLSVGRVRFGFEMGGVIHYVHQHLGANVTTIPWSVTPNLPLRYQIVTTSSSGVCSMRCICTAVLSEGGDENIGAVHHRGTSGAAVTCVTDNLIYAIVGLRLKAAYLGAEVDILSAVVQIQTASDSGEWLLIWNPTVADTFTYGDLADSVCQTALGVAANTVTNGTQVGGGFASSSGGGGGGSGEDSAPLHSSLHLGAGIAGARDELVLCFRPNAGTGGVEVEGALTWRESS